MQVTHHKTYNTTGLVPAKSTDTSRNSTGTGNGPEKEFRSGPNRYIFLLSTVSYKIKQVFSLNNRN